MRKKAYIEKVRAEDGRVILFLRLIDGTYLRFVGSRELTPEQAEALAGDIPEQL